MSDATQRPEVVVITGASAGVGRATARAFARRGAHVGLLARGRDGSGRRAPRRRGAGGPGARHLRPTSPTPTQVEAAATAVERAFGPIDVWVNNAMVSVFSPVKEMKPEEYRRVTEVTYLGTVYGTLAALRRMLPRDRGTIVQVGSALAYRGIPLQSAYCAAKHAIQGFCDSLHCELIHDKSRVRLTMVQMPALNTTAVRLGQEPPAAQGAAGPADLPAGGRRRGDRLGRAPRPALADGRLADRRGDRRQQDRPGLLDAYLARTCFDAQMTDEPEDPGRPDNLWEPVDAGHDRGAHGTFDRRSRDTSWQLWANMHRGWLAALAGSGLAGLACVALLNGRRR